MFQRIDLYHKEIFEWTGICLHIVKWIQVLICNIKKSVKQNSIYWYLKLTIHLKSSHLYTDYLMIISIDMYDYQIFKKKSFVCIQLNGSEYWYATLPNHLNSSFLFLFS